MIGQSHNEEIHRRHLAKYNTSVELATELLSFVQDEEGVTAEVMCRKDGQETKETIRAKYLVSAEGARSKLYHSFHLARSTYLMPSGITRKRLEIDFAGQTHDAMRMVLVDMYLNGLTNDVR
jgi:flavin-dependent dehydrogenase